MKPFPAGPDIWLMRPQTPAPAGWEVPNLYLLGQKELTLVDAGYPGDSMAEEILAAAHGRPLRQVLLTHGHLDHAGAVPWLKEKTGCTVLCHRLDGERLAKRLQEAQVDGWFQEGEVIEAESKHLRVLETPGHSPGHVAFWIEEEGTLFTGDLVTGAGSTFIGPPEGNMLAYMHSLEKVLALPAKRLLPGHGPLVADPQARIRELIAHRQLRELQIGKILEQGPRTLAQMVETAYGGLIHPGLKGAATITLLAHLDKLVAEGKVGFQPQPAPPQERTYFLTVSTPLPY